MAVIRVSESIWKRAYGHLYATPGEHFAFFLAKWSFSAEKPIFIVDDVVLIPDKLISGGWDGYQLNTAGILLAVNAAVKDKYCLIEIHNHGGSSPRWSSLDQQGLTEFVKYIHDSLPNRPYGATVWGDETIYGEYFLPGGQRGLIESITVYGDKFSQLISRHDEITTSLSIFDRQKVWFSEKGQKQLGKIRVGIIGCGGTGSHVVQQLVYLGCRDFVLVDDDKVEKSNLNRLVIATQADIDIPKVFLATQIIRKIAPESEVTILNEKLQSTEVLEALKAADIIFGCVDNDGARLVLNELALAYRIPYFDLATGIYAQEDGTITEAGGRVAVVLPEGPCLNCMGEIDQEEASFFLASPSDQAQRVRRGYVTGLDVKAPAVISLNGLVASAAVNEFAVYVSGIRKVSAFTAVDILGAGRGRNSQWVTLQSVAQQTSCVQCVVAGIGDKAEIMRYVSKL